uniref:Integral membrane protein n=1 Tax=Kitasatospora sp. CMC57 TaxID=3231513 RepID=A0AB33K221_9ACTN
MLGIELRRSAAPLAGLLVLTGSLAVLCPVDGVWWRGGAGWTAQWTSMALWTRSLLGFWWPLVVGLGALYGLRDSRSRMTELLASTPRPAWRRAALPAGATALVLVLGFGLLLLVGGVQVAVGGTDYLPLGWLPISLVAMLALVAGALFGMGVARALPSVLTPPALAVGVLLMTGLLLRQNAEGERPVGRTVNRLVLMAPAGVEPREMLLTLAGRVHLGQTLWLLGLLATGFALLAAASRRARLFALVPVLAGAALALLVLPADPRDTWVVDRAAASPVCDGPVCVTRANRSHLAEVAPQGREALRVLRDSLGDLAPSSVREDTALRAQGGPRDISADVVLLDFDETLVARATGGQLARVLVAQGLAPNCRGHNPREGGGQDDVAAQSIAASWALGDTRLTPLEEPGTDEYAVRAWAEAEAAWTKLTALPPAEQRARILQVRDASLACAPGFHVPLLAGAASR